MIRVGLIVSLERDWLGGVNYFKNLLNCYQKHPDPKVRIEVFSPHPHNFRQYECDAIGVHPWPEIQRKHVLRRFARKLLGYDPVLLGILKRLRVDLLTHYPLGAQSSINTLRWRPDFQHKRFPQFFTPEEAAARDLAIADCGRWGNILLSSHAAEVDFRRYYPELASVRTHVLHFSAAAILDAVPMNREELEAKYSVHEPYFYLPGQFWQHKNHSVVIEALIRTPSNVRVICTGAMDDYRNRGYVPSLMEKVKQAGLQDRFVCFGKVPYESVVSLMHHAIAVIQPSLCEGWSTSVEEAKAMCKQIILSKIDVHLEQAPERGVYFSPDSADELAAFLIRARSAFSVQIENQFAQARSRHRERTERQWIEEFVRIVKLVTA
jgi:glycosyltransferase involved in cell wall biosynthesis